ncbi:cysteine desulfurase/sulfurtransferase TusA family protein [Nocardioides aestuarii]|uniref:Cysteine desulfurase family protein n=1 Tax=Nocardioides aestuarii TaxID=252231 RepID=A0ABW4TI76_9ACTN
MTAPRTELDTASGEPLHPAAQEVLRAAYEQGYADPRRLHRPGRHARLMLNNARAATAEALGVRPDEVSFTGSGTEAVHRGLLGLVQGSSRGRRVVHSAVEHSAVRHAAAWAGDPVEVQCDEWGRVHDGDLVQEGIAPGVAVAALQTANHEVGTLQDVGELHLPNDIPLFTDACASMGRLPLPGGWAVAAGSAHKWGGPAGVGVMLVRKGARWRNPFPGDDRVDERVAGFENVPGALAAAAALQAVVAERNEVNARQHALVDRIRASVARIPDAEVVGDPDRRLPHLVTFSFLYVDGEALVHALDRHGFGVASGSACAASTLEPSAVLSAMRVLTHGNVRLSLGRTTTEAEVDRFLAVLPGVVTDLRAEVGL